MPWSWLWLSHTPEQNLYLQVEANRIQYDSARFDGNTADFKTGATVGAVGIGYKF